MHSKNVFRIASLKIDEEKTALKSSGLAESSTHTRGKATNNAKNAVSRIQRESSERLFFLKSIFFMTDLFYRY